MYTYDTMTTRATSTGIARHPYVFWGWYHDLMPMPPLIVTGAVARTGPQLPGSESSADIAMHAIMGGSASSPPTTAHTYGHVYKIYPGN